MAYATPATAAAASGVRLPQVQELAEGGSAPPPRYVHDGSNRTGGDRSPPSLEGRLSPPPSPFPVVDLGFLSRSAPDSGGRAVEEEEAARIRSALRSWGMVHARGHGMSASFLDEVRSITRDFFKLPMEEKERYRAPEASIQVLEGYGNDPIASEDQILDWCDRLYLAVQPEDERNLNLWPEIPTRFRDILHEYTMKTRAVAEHLLRVMARSLDLDDDHFVSQFGERTQAHARFNYYPKCSRPDLVFGLKPHSDVSVLTINLQDSDVGGLQVLKDGLWFDVPIDPHALLINVGDQMEIMSNGEFQSPVHRVITNSVKERISLTLFFDLEFEKMIEPAEGLIDARRPRLYKRVKVKDYFDTFVQKFQQRKRAIDCAKV